MKSHFGLAHQNWHVNKWRLSGGSGHVTSCRSKFSVTQLLTAGCWSIYRPSVGPVGNGIVAPANPPVSSDLAGCRVLWLSQNMNPKDKISSSISAGFNLIPFSFLWALGLDLLSLGWLGCRSPCTRVKLLFYPSSWIAILRDEQSQAICCSHVDIFHFVSW